jgi:hypothetical protein
MTTISSSTTVGITLTSPTDVNPIVINSGVTVSNKSGTAVYASGGSWTIQNSGRISGTVDGIYLKGGGAVVNSGTISATGTYAVGGVILGAGGSITNAASASIKGTYFGVEIFGGAGTVVNSGAIAATSGAIGVYLHAGGSDGDQCGNDHGKRRDRSRICRHQ